MQSEEKKGTEAKKKKICRKRNNEERLQNDQGDAEKKREIERSGCCTTKIAAKRS